MTISTINASWSVIGRTGYVVATGDGRINSFSTTKAGPAEVLLSAGNVPARGQANVLRGTPARSSVPADETYGDVGVAETTGVTSYVRRK